MAKFANDVLKMVSASLIAQVIGVLLVPIITRIYSPQDFGLFELMISIASIVSVISCLSYNMAIVIAKDDSEAIDVLRLCLLLLAFIITLISIITIFYSKDIANIVNQPQIAEYLPYLSIFILVDGMYPIFNFWLTRKGQFGVLGTSRVLRAGLTKILQIILGTSAASSFGLTIGYIAGYAASDVLMIFKSPSLIKIFSGFSINSAKEVAVRYKNFPIYSTWSSFAFNLSNQVPSLMLAIFYDTTVVGLYSLSYTIVSVPMNMVGSSIGQVFFQKAMKEQNSKGSVKNLVYKVYSSLVVFGLFPMLILMILSDDIFKFAFGSEWTAAGTYTKILVPWLFLVFISSPLSNLFNIFEKQKIGMKFQIFLVVSRIVSLYIGGTFGGPYFALSIFSFTGILSWLWMNIYLLKISGLELKEIKSIFWHSSSRACLLILPIIFAKIINLDFIFLLALTIIVSAIYYIPLIKKQFYPEITNFLSERYDN